MPVAKKKKPNRKQMKYIWEAVSEKLRTADLSPWQDACKSFGYIHYEKTTRREWFEKNEPRVRTARRIIRFIDGIARELRRDKKLESVLMSEIRSHIVEGIRRVQEEQGLELNRINPVKVSAFRTLIGYADHPVRLDEGPYEGASSLGRPSTRRGAERDCFIPPRVELAREIEMTQSKELKITGAIINRYKHPVQNVEIELETDKSLSVRSITPFDWSFSKNSIKIGFLEASLGNTPFEREFVITLARSGKRKSFQLEGRIHYDNTDTGERGTTEFAVSIKT